MLSSKRQQPYTTQLTLSSKVQDSSHFVEYYAEIAKSSRDICDAAPSQPAIRRSASSSIMNGGRAKIGIAVGFAFFKIHFIKYEDTTSLQVSGHSPMLLLMTITSTSDLQPSFCTGSRLFDLPLQQSSRAFAHLASGPRLSAVGQALSHVVV